MAEPTGSAMPAHSRRGVIVLWLLVGFAGLAVILANVHLVTVAVLSQPECVDHERAPTPGGASYSAAKSAC